jgi:double-stranded uracil-DNA glycosylase
MTFIYSFEPIEDEHAETLILGSIPGQASLAAGQYYAHHRNAFWLILTKLLQIDPAAPYETKIQALKSARIALWDVLQSCKRTGSLDSGIETDTLITNDFRTFFREHKKIKQVFFNGAKAEACFKRHILRHTNLDCISFTRLPSTSPANATISFTHKLAAWQLILDD